MELGRGRRLHGVHSPSSVWRNEPRRGVHLAEWASVADGERVTIMSALEAHSPGNTNSIEGTPFQYRMRQNLQMTKKILQVRELSYLMHPIRHEKLSPKFGYLTLHGNPYK